MSWKPNKNIEKIIKKALVDGNEDSIEVLQDKVKSNAPVDTGRYKKSIKTESSEGGLTQSVIVDVPYAQVVEFGKLGRAANPVVRSALAESKNKMLKKFSKKL